MAFNWLIGLSNLADQCAILAIPQTIFDKYGLAFLSEVGGTHAEMLLESPAERGRVAKTATKGDVRNAATRTVVEQLSRFLQLDSGYEVVGGFVEQVGENAVEVIRGKGGNVGHHRQVDGLVEVLTDVIHHFVDAGCVGLFADFLYIHGSLLKRDTLPGFFAGQGVQK